MYKGEKREERGGKKGFYTGRSTRGGRSSRGRDFRSLIE